MSEPHFQPASHFGTARASLMLVGATVFWGLSFPLIKNWQNAAQAHDFSCGPEVASLTLIGARTVFALLILAVFQPRLFLLPTSRDLGTGLLLGLLNSVGAFLQVLGLVDASPALSVFLTSLGSAWLPLFGFVLFRLTVPRLTIVGLVLGIAGVAVLGIKDASDWSLGYGEWLTLASSVDFALVILLLDRWGRPVPPGHLTIGLLAGTGLPPLFLAAGLTWQYPGCGQWLGQVAGLLSDWTVSLDLLLLVVFSTVLAFHWMSTYQPSVPASRAGLIYLLEPVFGSLFSLAWGHDQPSLRLLLGGGLIVGGNFVVEVPGLLRERQLRAAARADQVKFIRWEHEQLRTPRAS